MHLIIGLGNPGSRYTHNRHNIGFMAVDAIASAFSFPSFSRGFSGDVSEGKMGGDRVFLLKPLTYMNESGRSVGELARFYKIPVENMIVLHDELDLPLAKLRVKRGGGHGGHNGLKSIDAHMGLDYVRVRLGIGHPGVKELVSPYVLSDFRKEEMPAVESLIKAVAKNCSTLIAGDEAGFMNRVTLAVNPPAPKPAA